MVLFHLVRDLEFFGALPAGTTLSGGWALFARAIAGAFLLLSGITFVLCHGRGLQRRVWLQHLATVAAAAAVVSAITYVTFPERWVRFGILHAIAFCILLAPLALRLPMAGLAAAACGVALVNTVAGRAVFDAAALAWTGLGRIVPPSLDFIPVFPWAAAFLAGMALARAAGTGRLDGWRTDRSVPVATQASRHSLAIYLLHQPVLLTLIWVASGVIR